MLKRIDPGELRKRITIQSVTTPIGQSDFGEQQIEWQDAGSYWAKVEPLSGREFEHAKNFGASVTHKVTMRFYSGIDVTNRAVLDGRVFEINATIDEEEQHVWLSLYCTELNSKVPA